ncbi:MAG: Hsp20/alpha crystallin family protein, partial [Firmicutes bacterium]|nr:Hsp20/alpha crystallin family protein [Bacillota bacterium]
MRTLDELLWQPLTSGSAVRPAMNIKKTAAAFFIELAVPGYRKEDIATSIENGVLKVSGQAEKVQENGQHTAYLRREIQ